MKVYLALAVVLAGLVLMVQPAAAQWTQSGNLLYNSNQLSQVGIGTTSPISRLQVEGNAGANLFKVRNYLGQTQLTVSNNGFLGLGTWDPQNRLDVVGGDIGLTNMDAILFEDGGGSYAQGMYMDSNSRLHIDNLSGAASGVQIYTGADTTKASFVIIQSLEPAFSVETGSASPARVKVHSLASQGTVYSNNGVLTNTNPSSVDYKDEIQPVDLRAERILLLEPKSFVWRDSGEKDFGYIAEEVRDVLPEIYREDGGIKGYDTAKLSFYLVEMVKAQERRISALEEELANLKAGQSGQ